MHKSHNSLEASEARRIQELHRYRILDTPEEPQFQILVELVAKKLNFPIALITLVDKHRFWFKAKTGVELCEVCRNNELCSRVVAEKQTLTYRDLTEHSHLAKLEVVSGPIQLRAYAGAPLISPNDQAIGTLCLFDTQPHEMTETEIEELTDLAGLAMSLIEANRAKEENYQNHKLKSIERLAGGVAHDFNNLHSSILSAVDLIAATSEAQTAEINNFLNIIRTSSKRAADLTQQLLSFARKGKYKVEPLALNPLLDELSNLLRASTKSQHTICTSLSGADLIIDADHSQIHSALLNIALNGLDAMPHDGELRIESSKVQLTLADPLCQMNQLRTGTYACISIIDQGSGMSPETADQVFEPFFSNQPPSKGNGLGLPSAQGTITHHGGAITINSKVGEGSCMNIYLPLSQHPVDSIIAPAPAQDEFRGRVLLAEDEEMVREVTQLLLTQMGFHVEPFEDGFQAVNQLENNPPPYALLVLDISMPGKDGLEVAAAAQKLSANSKILFMSGNGPEEQLQPLLSQPNITFLQKPFGKKQLTQALKDLFEKETV